MRITAIMELLTARDTTRDQTPADATTPVGTPRATSALRAPPTKTAHTYEPKKLRSSFASTSDLIDTSKLKSVALSRGLGCDQCLAGLRSPAPLGIFGKPNMALQVCDWCDCETGEALRQRITGWATYDQSGAREAAAKEAKAKRLQYLFGDAGIPRQFQSYTFKGWDEKAGKDPTKSKLRTAVLEHFRNRGIEDANAPDGFYAGIIAYGPSDLGKTGGLVPLFKKYLEEGYTGLWVRYRDVMSMLKEFDQGDGSVVRERVRKLKDVPMLFLDELGDPGNLPTKYESNMIFEIISERRSQYLPTFITSNLQAAELKEHFGERTVKRIFELCAPCLVSGEPMGALRGIEF